MKGQALLKAWYNTGNEWKKVRVTAEGKLILKSG
jgi:hypothetical protein